MTVDFSSYTRGQWHPPQNLKYLLSKPLLSSVVTLCVDDEQDSPWLSLLPRFKVDTILQWHVYSPQQMNPIGCPSPSVYQACGYSQTHNQPWSTDFLGAEDPPYQFTSGTWWMAAYIPRCTFCLVFWPQKIKPQGDGGTHIRFNLLLVNLLSPSPPLRIGK